MKLKQAFWLGIISAGLSSVACIVYGYLHAAAFYVDFSKVLGPVNMIAASVLSCLLMALGYWLALRWRGTSLLGWLQTGYAVLSFVSILGVLGFQLPLEQESPELFPGLAIPMHFFPVLSIVSVFPFFHK
ncbi:MAG: hypothetical protein MUF42_05475 [Cytophagaceae bacterium]|jgi:hypothetical protein|nr:hypothetical protein [Cytophagaceae bacterium]